MPIAFKEWSLVCDALGDGRQSIILRKGGIAEGRDGFQFKHREFFLFPTHFHEQAKHLPRHLEPLIVEGEDGCSLWDLVEDELILAMPPYSYHETKDCNEVLADLSAQPAPQEEAAERSNPFDVLAQLKPGSK